MEEKVTDNSHLISVNQMLPSTQLIWTGSVVEFRRWIPRKTQISSGCLCSSRGWTSCQPRWSIQSTPGSCSGGGGQDSRAVNETSRRQVIQFHEHRHSWVIFRGGPTTLSCQNSILSCQKFLLSGGAKFPNSVLPSCCAKLLCQTVLQIGKNGR